MLVRDKQKTKGKRERGLVILGKRDKKHLSTGEDTKMSPRPPALPALPASSGLSWSPPLSPLCPFSAPPHIKKQPGTGTVSCLL